MQTFWEKLGAQKRPFFVLAPMADVTDPAYRKLIAAYGKPDVTWTEFVSADGLYYTREKKGMKDEDPSTALGASISTGLGASLSTSLGASNPLMRDLQFTEAERPIVAQLFGSNPETMAYAAQLCATLGFDGIDLNMGCPDKSIEKQGAGAAMIKSIESARVIIAAARTSGLPVSVKTRIGYNTEIIDEWIGALLQEQLPALTVHLRTRKEMSLVPAHWDLLPRVVALRDSISPETLIIGNGDLTSIEDARARVATAGADGAMLGRAIFGNPWLFVDNSKVTPPNITPEERLAALTALAQNFSELLPAKSFHLLKKHFKAFVSGWDGAAALRGRLMETNSLEEMRETLDAYSSTTS